MYTLKFEAWDRAYPLNEGTKREQLARSIALKEGEKIWHRPVQVRSLAELEKWKDAHGWGARHTTCYIPGEDPEYSARMKEKGKIPDRTVMHFEYMTFFDGKGELWKVIIFCCDCYIMNEAGQTVDSISA